MARSPSGATGHDRHHHFRARPRPLHHGARLGHESRARAWCSVALCTVNGMEHRWYAIQTTAGHENKVRSLIQRKIELDTRPAEDRPIRSEERRVGKEWRTQ